MKNKMEALIDTIDTIVTHRLGNTKTRRVRSRRWVFTLNNYTEEEIDRVTQKHYQFNIIFGKEIGKNGTPHLQGYIEAKNAIALSTLQSILPRAHWEKARGNRQSNIAYCSKDGNFFSTFEEDCCTKMLKSYNSCGWYPWQNVILEEIRNEPENRTINWIFDKTGNVGKSFLCKYLALQYQDELIIGEGKKTDVYNQILTFYTKHEKGPRIVILDIPRSNIDYINYAAVESIKNGLIYSGKYEGGICIFPYPHVYVFANERPDLSKFSRDRWCIREIQEDYTFKKNVSVHTVIDYDTE